MFPGSGSAGPASCRLLNVDRQDETVSKPEIQVGDNADLAGAGLALPSREGAASSAPTARISPRFNLRQFQLLVLLVLYRRVTVSPAFPGGLPFFKESVDPLLRVFRDEVQCHYISRIFVCVRFVLFDLIVECLLSDFQN